MYSAVDADISSNLENNYQSLSPFVKLFWEEQKKYFQSKHSGRRYHLMLIRYAISLSTKSPVVYEEIRKSGILKLPSMRTLRDYRNFIKPQTGFNPAVIEDLIKHPDNLTGYQGFVTLPIDESQILAGLVYYRN